MMSTKVKAKSKLNHEYRKQDLISTNQINLSNWNPNFVPSDIMDAIKDDMTKNGFIDPIVLQKYNQGMKKKNVIINGEHRFQAWTELGHSEIPAITLDVNDKTAKALTIRLNREHGEMLPNKIGDVLLEISKERDIAFLQDLVGMRDKDIEALVEMRATNFNEILEADPKLRTYRAKATKCPQCGHEFLLE